MFVFWLRWANAAHANVLFLLEIWPSVFIEWVCLGFAWYQDWVIARNAESQIGSRQDTLEQEGYVYCNRRPQYHHMQEMWIYRAIRVEWTRTCANKEEGPDDLYFCRNCPNFARYCSSDLVNLGMIWNNYLRQVTLYLPIEVYLFDWVSVVRNLH